MQKPILLGVCLALSLLVLVACGKSSSTVPQAASETETSSTTAPPETLETIPDTTRVAPTTTARSTKPPTAASTIPTTTASKKGMALVEAYSSKQPRFPQAQGRPCRSMDVCPSSHPKPLAPVYTCPCSTSPRPMPSLMRSRAKRSTRIPKRWAVPAAPTARTATGKEDVNNGCKTCLYLF